eukprot:scaffold1501_cov352-Pavlova_lutheri.AAC.43
MPQALNGFRDMGVPTSDAHDRRFIAARPRRRMFGEGPSFRIVCLLVKCQEAAPFALELRPCGGSCQEGRGGACGAERGLRFRARQRRRVCRVAVQCPSPERVFTVVVGGCGP